MSRPVRHNGGNVISRETGTPALVVSRVVTLRLLFYWLKSRCGGGAKLWRTAICGGVGFGGGGMITGGTKGENAHDARTYASAARQQNNTVRFDVYTRNRRSLVRFFLTDIFIYVHVCIYTRYMYIIYTCVYKYMI